MKAGRAESSPCGGGREEDEDDPVAGWQEGER